MDHGPDKLEDPSVAYAYAGFDQDFTFFKCYTRKLVDKTTGEVGQFETAYKAVYAHLERDNDPVGYLKRAMRLMLENNIKETGVQLEYWIIEFSPVMEKLRIPSHLYLDRAADRAWLA